MKPILKHILIVAVIVALISLGFYLNIILGLIMLGLLIKSIIFLFAVSMINTIRDYGKSSILYVIKKGKHYCDRRFPRFRFTEKKYTVTRNLLFTTSCLYHFNSVNDFDINKLFGITFGLDPVKNSVGFGWNCEDTDGKISLFVLIYSNGIMCFNYIGSVKVERWNKYTIDVNGNIVTLYLNGVVAGVFVIKTSHFIVFNRPYFGGDNAAPKDILIYEQ